MVVSWIRRLPENSGEHLPGRFAQQSLLPHLAGLPPRRTQGPTEFFECRGATARRADIQLAVLELAGELPNVHLAHAQLPRESTARPSPVQIVAPLERNMPDQLSFRLAAPGTRRPPTRLAFARFRREASGEGI